MIDNGFTRRNFLKTAGVFTAVAAAGNLPATIFADLRRSVNPPLPSTPDFIKSLPVDMAMAGDIIIAYEMNGTYLPMLNGLPARLIVPGWYATYWVKSLSDITVLDKPFEGFWMKTAYRIPDNPCGCVIPGAPQNSLHQPDEDKVSHCQTSKGCGTAGRQTG